MKNTAGRVQTGLTDIDHTGENQYFAEILPRLLGAVSQQFLNMLILRKLGYPALAMRIKEVDDADFVSSMKLMELLVTRGFDFRISSHAISPGACVESVIRAEQQSEGIINAGLARASSVMSDEGLRILDRLKQPRDSYGYWLSSKLSRPRQNESDSGTRKTVRALVSQLLSLMEQAMLDAFVFWAANNKEAANISWRISGASMLYLAACAELSGSVRKGANIRIAPSQIRNETEQVETERLLVENCSSMAQSAAYCCPDPTVTETLLEIATDCERLACLRSDPTIQLSQGYSSVFSDFQKAQNRMHA